MDNIRKVLEAYRIQVVTVEQITENLFRVSDGQHFYALKKSKLTHDSVTNWENVYHQALAQNMSAILPVYLTKQGNLYERENDICYYITPWFSSKPIEQTQQIERMYRSIGTIHAKTTQSLAIEKGTISKNFASYQAQLLKMRDALLQHVERFEKNRYMSPVELLVCTQYRELDFIFNELNRRVDQFIDDIDNQSDWQYCLCHGQLDFSHVIFHHHTYILNWEKAHFNNAAIDLAFLYHRLVEHYDNPADHLIELFSVYTNENKLTDLELDLLSIYLLDPTDYITMIEQYANNPSYRSVIDQVKQLQRTHRQLSFAMKWTAHSETIIESTDETES